MTRWLNERSNKVTLQQPGRHSWNEIVMTHTESDSYSQSGTNSAATDLFMVGPYRVNAMTGTVCRGRSKTRLEPRAMDVLVYLAASSGRVVSKSELKGSVWKCEYVVDEAVKRCISQIRKAFHDDPSSPSVIETVRKRGYRLIADVSADEQKRAVTFHRPSALAAVLLIGVLLPLVAYFSGSIESASEISDRLDVHSIARSAYSQYDRDGNDRAIELYEYLIEKNPEDAVAHSGLADALMQSYLRWDRDEAIARRAQAAALRSREINPGRPDALKALGAYHHFRGERYLALESYAEAIEIDPTYWMALNNGAEILRDFGEYSAARNLFYCALNATPHKLDVLLRLAGVELRAGRHEEAAAFLNTVLMLNPSNEEALTTLALIHSPENESHGGLATDEVAMVRIDDRMDSRVRELAMRFEKLDCQTHSAALTDA